MEESTEDKALAIEVGVGEENKKANVPSNIYLLVSHRVPIINMI